MENSEKLKTYINRDWLIDAMVSIQGHTKLILVSKTLNSFLIHKAMIQKFVKELESLDIESIKNTFSNPKILAWGRTEISPEETEKE